MDTTSVLFFTFLNAIIICLSTQENINNTRHWYETNESLLMKELTRRLEWKGYPQTRPLSDIDKPTEVTFGLSLIQIIEFDTKQQIITLSVWQRMFWRDNLFIWNPSDYGGTSQINIPIYKVWNPDMELYNSAESKPLLNNNNNLVMVVASSDGSIIWIPPIIYKCRCAADTTEFPFDEHICNFTIGSWTYNGDKLQPILENGGGFHLQDYSSSRLWQLRESYAVITSKTHKCCADQKFPKMIFSLRIRRKPDVQEKVLLVPASGLPILAMLIFWIPPERPDRLALGVTVFSAYFLLLIVMTGYVPPESDSKFATMCAGQMVLVGLSIIWSVISIKIARKHSPVPACINEIFLRCLGRIFFVTGDNMKYKLNTSNSSDNAHIESSMSEPRKVYRWKHVSRVLDKLGFLLYLIAIIVVFLFYFPKRRYKD